MGGDGHTCTLTADGARWNAPRFSQTCSAQQLAGMLALFAQIQGAFQRLGVTNTTVNDFQSTSSMSSLRARPGSRVVSMWIPHLLEFTERVGFRYCWYKQMKLSVMASYLRLSRAVTAQRIESFTTHYHHSSAKVQERLKMEIARGGVRPAGAAPAPSSFARLLQCGAALPDLLSPATTAVGGSSTTSACTLPSGTISTPSTRATSWLASTPAWTDTRGTCPVTTCPSWMSPWSSSRTRCTTSLCATTPPSSPTEWWCTTALNTPRTTRWPGCGCPPSILPRPPPRLSRRWLRPRRPPPSP